MFVAVSVVCVACGARILKAERCSFFFFYLEAYIYCVLLAAPQPDWTQARHDLGVALDSATPRHGTATNGESLGAPVLVVIPVKDSALQRDSGCEDAALESTRESILKDAWEGLGLRGVAERGFSFRVALVGLHEFESRSKAAAATQEGLVFAGGLEEACSKDVAVKLAELAGVYCFGVGVEVAYVPRRRNKSA